VKCFEAEDAVKNGAVEIDMDQNSPLTERDPAHRSAES